VNENSKFSLARGIDKVSFIVYNITVKRIC
jgi:hypothetical protein